MTSLLYVAPLLGIIGLVVMFAKAGWVKRQAAGDDRMQEIATAIAQGALAFLRAEWKILIVFGVVVSALLAFSGTLVPNSSWVIGLAFAIGALSLIHI